MDAATRKQVRDRAANRCEYCQLPQRAAGFLKFHIEHIRAQQHIKDDSLENLALACPDCNRFKGPNLSSIDPDSGRTVALFNPRRHRWNAHFVIEGPAILGRTPTGRATVHLLCMNNSDRLEMREELLSSDDS